MGLLPLSLDAVKFSFVYRIVKKGNSRQSVECHVALLL